MRAHQVKCKICAPGVRVVTYIEKGDDNTNVMLVSANLTEAEAIDLVCRHLAIEKTTKASQDHGVEMVYTPEDIKAGYTWQVFTTKILAHL